MKPFEGPLSPPYTLLEYVQSWDYDCDLQLFGLGLEPMPTLNERPLWRVQMEAGDLNCGVGE